VLYVKKHIDSVSSLDGYNIMLLRNITVTLGNIKYSLRPQTNVERDPQQNR